MPYVNVRPMDCQSEPSYTLSAQLDLYITKLGRSKPNKMMVKGLVNHKPYEVEGPKGPKGWCSILPYHIKDGSLKLNQLNNYCKEIMALDKLKLSFIKQVGAENWESAMLKYPAFASEQKLLDLFVPNFNPESLSFMDYCRRAVM